MIDELELLRAHAHAAVRTETRLAEMRGAKLAGRRMAHHDYVAARDDRDSLLTLWMRLYGKAQLVTGVRPSVPHTDARSSEPSAPVPGPGRAA